VTPTKKLGGIDDLFFFALHLEIGILVVMYLWAIVRELGCNACMLSLGQSELFLLFLLEREADWKYILISTL